MPQFTPDRPAPNANRWPPLPVAGTVVLLAAVLRLAAATDEFWLDEVWSLGLTAAVDSFAELFTRATVDNNHFLNSAILYTLGPDRDPFLYRLPAVLAGVGTVVAAGILGARRGPAASLQALAVFAFSFLMIQYASEARGYAYLCCFTLVAYGALLRWRDRPSWSAGLGFVLACILGILAHLSFLFAYGSFLAWSLWFESRRCGWRRWLLLHAVPLAFLGFLYAVSLRRQVIGGGDPYEVGTVLVRILSVTVGGPDEGSLLAGAAATLAALVFAAELVARLRDRDDTALVFAGVLVLPTAMLLTTTPEVLYPRYFLVPATFWLLAFSSLLARLAGRGPAARATAVVLLLAFLAANAWQTQRLLRLGRGHYREALALMRKESHDVPTAVGGDSDFRHDTMVRYYGRREGFPIEYLPRRAWPPMGPEWVVCHLLDASPEPLQTDDRGNRYLLVRTFPAAGLSGWGLAVYQRERK